MSPFRPKGTDVSVPCGRCPECRIRKVQEWIFRIQQEAKMYDRMSFVTLTYNTQYVPISKNGFMTLDKKDLQKFFKRLRHHTDKIRYYAVGEYGSLNKRPHYHIILFGEDDKNLIDKAWKIGYTHVGNVNQKTIAYTLKYVDKGKSVPAHKRDDRIKEFSLVSKNLGKNYVTDSIIKYHNANPFQLYTTEVGGKKIPMSRYYRKMLFDADTQKRQQEYVDQLLDEKYWEEVAELEKKGIDAVAYMEARKMTKYKRFYKNQKIRKL